VWHVLKGQFQWLLANPTQVKALRGRKSDLRDGERIADYLQHGLLEGSFVPPQPIQELRDLTRSRTTLKQEQVRVSNRILKVLEDANLCCSRRRAERSTSTTGFCSSSGWECGTSRPHGSGSSRSGSRSRYALSSRW
jgi:transposase